MTNRYIQFEVGYGGVNRKHSRFQKVLTTVLEKISPAANPDFDGKIDNVKTWMVEFEDGEELPNRELGLDKDGKVIMIMPYERNCGYWTDNNLTMVDFKKHFDTTEISQEEFEKYWHSFINQKA